MSFFLLNPVNACAVMRWNTAGNQWFEFGLTKKKRTTSMEVDDRQPHVSCFRAYEFNSIMDNAYSNVVSRIELNEQIDWFSVMI